MIAHIYPDDPTKVQTVEEHLVETAKIAKIMGEAIGMGELCFITALFHDLGKFRLEFERYIRNAIAPSGRKNTRERVNHSSAGAIYIYRRYYKGEELQKLTAQLICEAILSHHGLNDCMSAQGEDIFRKRVENLEKLDYEEVVRNLEESDFFDINPDDIFRKAKEEVEQLQQKILEGGLSKSFTNGLIERMLLSVIIDADRINTAAFCGDREEEGFKTEANVAWDMLQRRLENKLGEFPSKEGISAIRRNVSDECDLFANHPPGIYRLSVPTGGGKTLSSMRYAFRHAMKYNKKRIFYISPYLSILEQNSQVFREVINDDSLILEHHSNVIIEEDAGNEEIYNRYKHLTENWDSPIVISTFVQFLNTLFGGKTSSIRRFHNLSNSIILIDEIQSLPITMIHLFNMTMNYLKTMCGATAILCSATQPILDQVEVPIQMAYPADMISDTDGLYRSLKRVSVEAVKGIFTTESLCGFLSELIKVHRSTLVILNTKKAVRVIYQELVRRVKETGEEVTILQLSTNMCPEHRLKCIERMKKEVKTERIICISTSLIEAGVDISFSCILRSYAGLDAIAQAAGRCNRNGEEREGKVYLIRYEEEKLGRLIQTKKGAACSESVVELFQQSQEEFDNDLLSRPALRAFYQRYYYDEDQKREMTYPLKELGSSLVDLLTVNMIGKMAFYAEHQKKPDLALFQAFKTAGDEFSVINQDTRGILVPFEEGVEIISRLNGDLSGGEISKWLRKAQRFTVNLYQEQINELNKAGALTTLKSGQVLALKEGFYDNFLGIVSEGNTQFLFID